MNSQSWRWNSDNVTGHRARLGEEWNYLDYDEKAFTGKFVIPRNAWTLQTRSNAERLHVLLLSKIHKQSTFTCTRTSSACFVKRVSIYLFSSESRMSRLACDWLWLPHLGLGTGCDRGDCTSPLQTGCQLQLIHTTTIVINYDLCLHIYLLDVHRLAICFYGRAVSAASPDDSRVFT